MQIEPRKPQKPRKRSPFSFRAFPKGWFPIVGFVVEVLTKSVWLTLEEQSLPWKSVLLPTACMPVSRASG